MPPDEMSDHDRIVEMHTDIRYIVSDLRMHRKSIEKHHERISALESWKNTINGVVVGMGLAVGGAWAKLMKLL